MIRRDIIEAAGRKPGILFPIFTNGTYMDARYFELFDKCRNLLPIMSIEGDREKTDSRRGKGIYDKLIENMDKLHARGLIFGASVTVTTENYREVTSPEFLKELSDGGCKAVIYVEFVPVTDESQELAPGDSEREYLAREIESVLRVSRELKADFLGLAAHVERADPAAFRRLDQDFAELLPALELEITVGVRLRHSFDRKEP